MDEDKIVLDRKSFEALAVDSRIKILKSLKERRKTLSEISKEQEMSLSGVKEHLETLEGVGLIEKKDDGHKWKYYELTRKGMDIVGPRELRVWILLSLSTVALVASMFALFSVPDAMVAQTGAYGAEMPEADRAMEPAPMLASANADMTESADGQSAPGAGIGAEATDAGDDDSAPPPESAKTLETGNGEPETTAVNAPEGLPEPAQPYTVPLAVALISGLTLLGCLTILAKNRMKVTSP